MIELLLLLPTQPVTVAEALQAMRSAYDTAVVASLCRRNVIGRRQ